MKIIKLISVIAAIVCAISPAHAQQRSYYLTADLHMGNSVLEACAPGFHTAHYLEIFDPSNLVYNIQLGYVTDDSGFGPPDQGTGWIRSGTASNIATNCALWTSTDSGNRGMIAALDGIETTMAFPLLEAVTSACDIERRVWCVSDPVPDSQAEPIHCDGFEDCPPN